MKIPQPIADKLDYAKSLLHTLDAQIVEYLDEKSDDQIRQAYANVTTYRSVLEGKEIPILISLICGDVLQNTRSVLDYLVWELVLANKQVPDEANAFPVCKTTDSFKEAQKRRLRGVDPAATAIIESLQPYHFGPGKETESVVFVLDKLANIQKHRTILMTRERHAPVDLITAVDAAGNVLGFDPLRATDAKANAEFIRNAIENKAGTQMAVFVEFGEGPMKGTEVMSVVSGLYDHVALGVVPQFNRFF